MNELNVFSYSRGELSLMPPRPAASNKGSFGRVLCVCGSHGMAGAAYFAAKAALRTGAGLVEIMTPEVNRSVLQSLLPEAVICTYAPEELNIRTVEAAVKRASAIVCGCGIGVTREAERLLATVLRYATAPTVLDADALNVIARAPQLLPYARGKIITPHPLEFSRLTSLDVEAIEATESDRINTCRSFAAKHGLTCVLKGHRTVVSDGTEDIYINVSGNSGMATGGSGDVLAGIIGGILAQAVKQAQVSELRLAALGVYIHGLCGDVAAERLGEYSVIASDIIDALPTVLKEIKPRS